MKKLAIILALTLTLLCGCQASDKILAKSMTEKYSNDANYVRLSGEVIEFDRGEVTIKCEELKTYVQYEDEICYYNIYGENENFTLNVGDEIEFVTVPFHFYNGHLLPIVEVVLDGEVLLEFEDGKAALIDWVDKTFN